MFRNRHVYRQSAQVSLSQTLCCQRGKVFCVGYSSPGSASQFPNSQPGVNPRKHLASFQLGGFVYRAEVRSKPQKTYNARCRHQDIQETASCTRFVLPILQQSVLCRCKALTRLLPPLLSVVTSAWLSAPAGFSSRQRLCPG